MLWGLTGLMVLAGAALVVLSALTPVYTDPAAYEHAQEAVRQSVYGAATPDYDAATRAFYDVLDRFETRKWLYADLGASLLAWSGLVAVALTVVRATAGRLATRRTAIVVSATALALGLLWGGLVSSPMTLFDRYQLPEWSDTIGIPIYGATIAVMMLTPLVAALVLPPLFLRRAAPEGLLRSGRGRAATVAATLIYLPPVGCAVYLLAAVVEPGGWLMSTAAWLLIWVQLNARALWLAPPRRGD